MSKSKTVSMTTPTLTRRPRLLMIALTMHLLKPLPLQNLCTAMHNVPFREILLYILEKNSISRP